MTELKNSKRIYLMLVPRTSIMQTISHSETILQPSSRGPDFVPLTIDDLRHGLSDEQLAAVSKGMNVAALVNGLYECALHAQQTKCSAKACMGEAVRKRDE